MERFISSGASSSSGSSGTGVSLSMKRPAASLEASSSAAPPASKRSKLSTNPSGGASGSGAQPATFSEQVEQQVEQLGSYPKRFRKRKIALKIL